MGVARPDGGLERGPITGNGGVTGLQKLVHPTLIYLPKPSVRQFYQTCIKLYLTNRSRTGVALPDGGSERGPNSGNTGVPGVGGLIQKVENISH